MRERERGWRRRERKRKRKQGKRKEGQKHEFIFSFYEYGVFYISSHCFLVWGLLDQNEREIKVSFTVKTDLIQQCAKQQNWNRAIRSKLVGGGTRTSPMLAPASCHTPKLLLSKGTSKCA